MTRTVEKSKRINSVNIIISASGMATGGRVLHHLARRLPDSRNAVLLAGFQAEGTRGRALLDGAKTNKMGISDLTSRLNPTLRHDAERLSSGSSTSKLSNLLGTPTEGARSSGLPRRDTACLV